MEENISLSVATDKLTGMVQGAIALLPNLVIGLVIFVLFWFAGRMVRAFVRQQTRHRDTRNVGLVFGRLAQGGLIILGFLIAATVVFPMLQTRRCARHFGHWRCGDWVCLQSRAISF